MLTHWFDVKDPAFTALVFGNVHVERIIENCRFAEGPAYFAAGRYFICSDIPNDRMLRWDETNGMVSVFRQPCGYANGNTVDRQGRLITCEHGGRRVSRTEHDGSITSLASHFDGARLNSPNDVVVKSDNTIWFTDSSYGIDSHYEGDPAPQEQKGRYVFRRDGEGRLSIVTDQLEQPNGLAFSPDEKVLYIVDSGRARNVRRFDVGGDHNLTAGDVFAECPIGIFDGIRSDDAGNLWASAGDGVYCYDPRGKLLGRIVLPEVASNLCFGGVKRNRMFITAATSVYAVFLKTRGPEFRMDR
jgi:gluconolactonase